MLGNCDNKGCCKTTELLLDVSANEVICQECGKAIKSMPDTMKKMLKQQGKIIRKNIQKSFMMGCSHCNANREIILDATNRTLCKVCGNEVKVHPIMREAMLQVKHLSKEDE